MSKQIALLILISFIAAGTHCKKVKIKTKLEIENEKKFRVILKNASKIMDEFRVKFIKKKEVKKTILVLKEFNKEIEKVSVEIKKIRKETPDVVRKTKKALKYYRPEMTMLIESAKKFSKATFSIPKKFSKNKEYYKTYYKMVQLVTHL